MSHAHPENRLEITLIDRLLVQVQHYARAIATNPVAGDVHQLRVNLRRLKTGISVLSFSGGNDELKDRFAEEIAPLFSAAGKLRDTQINQMMAGQLKLLNGFVASQKHAEQKLLKRLMAEINRIDFAHLEELKNKLFPKGVVLTEKQLWQQARGFISEKQEKIGALRKLRMSNHTLHKIRIQMKAVSDCLLLWKDLLPDAGLLADYSAVKKMNDRLGDWHDERVLIDSVKLFLRKASPRNKTAMEAWVVRRDMACRKNRNAIYTDIRHLAFVDLK